jgi:uncharacterized protein YjiK
MMDHFPEQVRALLKDRLAILMLLLFPLCEAAGCAGNDAGRGPVFQSPQGYDLQHPYIQKLPLELDEISGLAYVDRDSSLLAINDERGWLYKIHPGKPAQLEKWAFDRGGDYEDLVVLGDTIYVLQSNGNLVVLSFLDRADSLYRVHYEFDAKSGGEFESLYWDPGLRQMTLVCKDCKQDKKKEVSRFLFQPDGHFEMAPAALDAKGVAALIGEKSIRFKPSAAAIHPLTGELYLISAVNKLLVIAQTDGTIQQAFHLNPALYKQPEGLAFDPAGNLYISNEAAEVGLAELLILPYHRNTRR